ncbi:hypothetical protein [Pectobacterium jejuense]|uniref:Uncharacterized protein n=1 Tax=Pectobacterium jejuense TaxID=2974022 RepID=A0ABW8H0A7_9GAMM
MRDNELPTEEVRFFNKPVLEHHNVMAENAKRMSKGTITLFNGALSRELVLSLSFFVTGMI